MLLFQLPYVEYVPLYSLPQLLYTAHILHKTVLCTHHDVCTRSYLQLYFLYLLRWSCFFFFTYLYMHYVRELRAVYTHVKGVLVRKPLGNPR